MPPLKITYKDGEFRVSDGERDQSLQDYLNTVNHCKICNAIIHDTRHVCAVCEAYYPCKKCINSAKGSCMCEKWKLWFFMQWSKLGRTHDSHEGLIQ